MTSLTKAEKLKRKLELIEKKHKEKLEEIDNLVDHLNSVRAQYLKAVKINPEIKDKIKKTIIKDVRTILDLSHFTCKETLSIEVKLRCDFTFSHKIEEVRGAINYKLKGSQGYNYLLENLDFDSSDTLLWVTGDTLENVEGFLPEITKQKKELNIAIGKLKRKTKQFASKNKLEHTTVWSVVKEIIYYEEEKEDRLKDLLR